MGTDYKGGEQPLSHSQAVGSGSHLQVCVQGILGFKVLKSIKLNCNAVKTQVSVNLTGNSRTAMIPISSQLLPS